MMSGDVLEIGTGMGIIPMYFTLNGSKANFTLTDYYPEAIDTTLKNIKLNKLQLEQFELIVTDRFDGLKKKFTFAFSNPPVQPFIPNAHLNDKASKSNENGNGRLVLDAIIQHGKNYLIPGGKFFFSTSTRHGLQQNRQLLDKYWGKENWREVLNIEYLVNPTYHGPYMNTWIKLQNDDGDLRVYKKNQNDEPISGEYYDPEEPWYFKYILLEATNI